MSGLNKQCVKQVHVVANVNWYVTSHWISLDLCDTYRIAGNFEGSNFQGFRGFLLILENFILEFCQKSRTDLAI